MRINANIVNTFYGMKYYFAALLVFLITTNSFGQSGFFYANTVTHFETVVNGNQQWHYFVGNSEPDSNWRRLSFNDAAWSTGNGGIGYRDNDDSTVIAGCTSLYLRKLFSISDTSKITELLLSIDYDDGFVAYINNVEVARSNVGTPGVIPFYNTPATLPHEANLYRSLNAEYFFINKDILKSVVTNGSNVLCIQIHNNSTSGLDNDLTAIPYLMAGLNTDITTYSQNPGWFKPPFYSHLPILQIIANNIAILNEPKKNMAMRIIYNGPFQNHLTDSATEYSGKIGIELHGASSLNFAQKSYGVTTYDSNNVADNVKLFDFPKESDYILYGPYNDKSLMRNVMMYDLARKMGWYAPRCKFIEVFLDTQYIGIYVFTEKIKIDKNRVAISQILPTHNAGDSLTGGYIFKVDWNADPGLGTWNSHITNFNGVGKTIKFQTSDPNGLDITASQRNYVESYIDSFEQNLASTAMNNLTTGYRKYIDVGSFIDYYILYEITHNVDAYRASTYFFKNKASQGGKIVMGPVWDFNYSLGNANFCGSNDTNAWCGCTANNTIWWFDALNAENYYRDQLRCRWTSLFNTILSPYAINQYIDSVAAYLEVPQRRHFIRWNILGTDLNNGHTSSAYSQEISWLKNWYRGRVNWVNLFMPGWHNPCSESGYTTRLIVTELNYNSDKNFDPGNWIELYNNSSGIVNLNNFTLSVNGGANSKKFGSLVIPAFSYIVICEDTNLFNQVYPNVKNKVGNLFFGFNNNGGNLILYDVSSYQVFNFKYSNLPPWPQGPDGGGRTLEHVGLTNTYNSYLNWFEGCIGGSPGKAYGRCLQDVNVTEINYNAAASHNTGDWFEIKNNSNSSKNIGGYVFKDDDNTHNFTFPPNFSIGPNEYFVVCADTAKFKSFYPNIKNRIGNFNFGLSNKNDAIRLFTNTNMPYQSIYYTDTAAPWPNGANGTGFTIELKNDSLQCDLGSNWTLGCIYGSPGKRYHKLCNPAATANLIVSELNLNPPSYADDGGWVEIHNYDTLDIDVTDFTLSHAANNDTSYIFKEGIIIKKNDYLILCNDTSRFKKMHPGITKIFALNKWKFNANSDSIVLKDFNGSNLIKMKYDYSPVNYAEAKGLGKTLELLKDTSNLNNPTNWFTGCFGGSPAAAYKACDKSKLIVTEINYKSSVNFNQGFWFEIKNSDTASINLDNYYFRRAFDTTRYKFNPNLILLPQSYFVVSYDSLNFTLNNSFVQNALFKPANPFNIKGDIIQLFDLNRALLNAQYKDTVPYPLSANGGGYTLNLINDSLNPFQFNNFITQCYSGSPGTGVLLPCNPALSSQLRISEINYKSYSGTNSGFWFEVANKDNIPLSLRDWVITNSDLKNNFKINYSLSIPGNGFWVFASDSIKFKKQFPFVTNVYFIPSLFNLNSDSIQVYDYRGFQACKAFYSNDTSWVQGANGKGYTLERNSLTKNGTLKTDWKIGCINGSPGKDFAPCNVTKLTLTEINYKPSANNNSGQWLELKNTGAAPLNLNNFTLRFNTSDSLKINAILAPSKYLVIVNDSILFKQSHPFIPNYVFNNFKLDTLENLIAIMENGLLVNCIYYSSSNSQLQLANGNGYTLELKADSLPECLETSWTTGCLKGSPGTALLSPCKPAISSNLIFSEINYLSDTFNNSGQWFEVYNNSAQPLTLVNWVLQNSSKSFDVIKEDIIIPANGYWVFSNDTSSFHATYPLVQNVSFVNLKMSKTADSISLSDYSESLACKAFYSSIKSWPQGANGNGRTLENISINKNTIDIKHWKQGCILGSPGFAFSGCKDRVWVTELNYHPAGNANDGKWIELYITSNNTGNISKYFFRSGDTITSYNTLNPTVGNDYFVLCSDSTSFNKYHKFILNKEQFASLNISNGTHNLVVYDQNHKILQSIQYSSEIPWDTLANGNGFTLELIKDSINFSNSNNWKSYCKRGSAGMATLLPCGNAFGIADKKPSSYPKVYPNPAGNELTIDPGIEFKAQSVNPEFKIMDLTCQIMIEGFITDNSLVLNITNLAAGVYILELDGMQPVKFIKK